MQHILVIGIGAGGLDLLTVEAVQALNTVDAIFITDKGPARAGLAAMRREICQRHIAGRQVQTIDLPDPPRQALSRDSDPALYGDSVRAWHSLRADLWQAAFHRTLGTRGVGAILVWGDPGLYDSTVRIIGLVAARARPEMTWRVIPGVSSVNLLAARHRITLNQIGAAVHVTTGRRLVAEGPPPGLYGGGVSLVVMLDTDAAWQCLGDRENLDIFWGACLGTRDERLLSGRMAHMAEALDRTRAEIRARCGWVMDLCLVREVDQCGAISQN